MHQPDMRIEDAEIQVAIDSSGGNVVHWGRLNGNHENWTFFYDRTGLFSASACGVTVNDVRRHLDRQRSEGRGKNDIIAMALSNAIREKWLEAYGDMDGASEVAFTPHFFSTFPTRDFGI